MPDAAGPTADASARLARPADAAAIAGVQAASWQTSYAALLPRDVVEEFDLAVATEAWSSAIIDAPSARHRLLVALDGGSLVGFASYGPAEDEDADPQTTAELLAIHLSPQHLRAGHGSRLMAALVDHARSDGFGRLVTWVFAADDPLRAFLASAGWDFDGATRDLELGQSEQLSQLVHQVRLHTDISAPTASIGSATG